MTPATLRALLVALAVTPGCAALDQVETTLASTGAFEFGPGEAVRRDGAVDVVGASNGRGVVVGPRRVLTVAHVVGEAAEVDVATGYTWSSARVVRRHAAWPEPLVELELARDAFGPDEVLAPGAGASPAWVLAADGPRPWSAPLRPGDSGSPVVDPRGLLVGLAVGNQEPEGGTPVLAALPALPAPPRVVVARR